MIVRAPQEGTVVDEQTHAPLPGASVCVETWAVGPLPTIKPIALDDAILVTTDEAGRYAVAGKREWHFTLIFPDAGPAWFPRLIVSHPGYRDRVVDSRRRAPPRGSPRSFRPPRARGEPAATLS
jgi:hypothetical protein